MSENVNDAGVRRFQDYRERQMAYPEFRKVYEEEAAKKELWLQLVEARQEAGLTQVELAERLGVSQAQVARLEKRGYDAYSLRSLRRYLAALGNGFSVEVVVRQSSPPRTQTAQSESHREPEQARTS